MSGNFNPPAKIIFNPPARISDNPPVVSSSQVGSRYAVNSGTGERRNGGSSSEPPYDAHIEQSEAETPRGSGAYAYLQK
jgi:hypothetical protein